MQEASSPLLLRPLAFDDSFFTNFLLPLVCTTVEALDTRGLGQVRSAARLEEQNGLNLSYKYNCLSTVRPAGTISLGNCDGVGRIESLHN